jgi:arabinose-5-phosphate isomerase
MERAGISPEDFAMNHPAGSLGRQLTLTVADLMVPTTALEGLSANASLAEVIGRLTEGSNGKGSLGAAWVRASANPELMAGLITDGDLRRTLQHHPPEAWAELRAGTMATANPITVTPEVLAVEALKLMELNPHQAISVLPVVDPNQPHLLLGLLRLHDLVQAGFTSTASERP